MRYKVAIIFFTINNFQTSIKQLTFAFSDSYEKTTVLLYNTMHSGKRLSELICFDMHEPGNHKYGINLSYIGIVI